jgi:hypothetical protein
MKPVKGLGYEALNRVATLRKTAQWEYERGMDYSMWADKITEEVLTFIEKRIGEITQRPADYDGIWNALHERGIFSK